MEGEWEVKKKGGVHRGFEFWVVGFTCVRGRAGGYQTGVGGISVMKEGSERTDILVGFLGFKRREWANGYLGFIMGKENLCCIFEYDTDDDIICDVNENRKVGRNWVFDGLFNFFLKVGQINLSSRLWTNWGIFTVEGQANFYPP